MTLDRRLAAALVLVAVSVRGVTVTVEAADAQSGPTNASARTTESGAEVEVGSRDRPAPAPGLAPDPRTTSGSPSRAPSRSRAPQSETCVRREPLLSGFTTGLAAWLGRTIDTKAKGRVAWTTCTGAAGSRSSLTGLIRPVVTAGSRPEPTTAPAGPSQPLGSVLAAAAAASLVVEVPEVSTAPPRGGIQLVGVPVWFWTTNERSVAATASIPGLSATVTAVALDTTLSFDDGATVTCRGGGTAYPAPAEAEPCAHRFERGGDHPVAVTVRWTLTWLASDGTGGTLPDAVRVARLGLQVREAEAVTD